MNATLRTIIGAIAGAAGGYALYRVVGCRTGACPLYSNPYFPVIIWGVVGAIIARSFKKSGE
ncbi:MAG: hypothetical protein V1789_06775 [PVC group bacterium]